MKAKKVAKRVCGIAAVLLAGLLLLIGSYLYSARYRISDIDAATSPDGEYKIIFQAVGEPDWQKKSWASMCSTRSLRTASGFIAWVPWG